jgi:type IV pilus assembly protein PilP
MSIWHTGHVSALALLTALLLAACDGSQFKDLEAYTQEIKARPPGQIEPLPEIKPLETFSYAVADQRDPFTPPPRETTTTSASALRPDPNRPKEALEAYPLDTLRMVGTFELSAQKWSLVKAPDGVVYRVQPNNYLGQSDGKVTSISDEAIELIEIIEDGQGGWIEQPASIALSAETEG